MKTKKPWRRYFRASQRRVKELVKNLEVRTWSRDQYALQAVAIMHRLRDMECSHRKSADSWHNNGAPAQAACEFQIAEALNSICSEFAKTCVMPPETSSVTRI